jgi:F420-dependent oxidoreductase-like protein
VDRVADKRPIRFGIFPGAVGMTWKQLLEVWKFADEVGYSTAWIPDHFYAGYGDPEGPCFEAWSVVAAMATQTKRIRIGPMVSGNTYRHPAVLANVAATIDLISGGRLELGIGAGWMKAEHEGYGIPLPPPKERMDRLDEALHVLRLLFTQRRASFQGTYYQLNDALCEPKPTQKPYPRILVGGGGEKRTLRIAAKYADEWNGEVSPRGMQRKIDVLREHCRAIGRDPTEIEVSVLLRSESEAAATYDSMIRTGNLNVEQDRQRLIAEGVSATDLEERLRAAVYEQFLPEDEVRAVDRLCEYAAVGVSHVIVIFRPPYDFNRIERLLTKVGPRVNA